MKKLLCVLLSITLLCLCGCAASQPNGTAGSSEPSDTSPSDTSAQPTENVQLPLFTDEFFADVVEIGELFTGKVSGEQMTPIIAYLKSLELEPTDRYLSNYDENGNMLFGGSSAIEFIMNDGTSVEFLYNEIYLTNTDGSCSFVLVEGNLYEGLDEAFDQAMNGGEG